MISDHPKTEAGNRIVPVPDEALRIFELAKKCNPDDEFIFVFRNERIKGEKFRRRLAKVCAMATVEYRKTYSIRKNLCYPLH